MENIYGADNIRKWADADNRQSAEAIEDRVNWALCRATEDLNDRMRSGPYAIPFDPVPGTIVHLTALHAGVILYLSPRGITDADDAKHHELAVQQKEVDMKIRRLLAGALYLDAEVRCTTVPKVIPSA